MEGTGGRESDPGFWQECWEAERQELERSERVQSQLQTVLQSLQQRCTDLEAENARIKAEVRPDATTEHLESEADAAIQGRQALEARQSALSLEILRHQNECEARAEQSSVHAEMLTEGEVARDALEEARRDGDARRERAALKSRSMVMAETLRDALEEESELQSQLQVQEAETAELREALADSWAARADPGDDGDAAASSEACEEPGAALQALQDMQDQLQWLATVQQEAAGEVHHVQKMERTEAALQAQLRAAMEENAALRNTRMDLGDAGHAMREALASQSERYVGRVGGLAEERRRTDTDREKLMQECAELQARLDVLRPELEDLEGLEGRHKEMEAERLALSCESERLRTVNASLGVLLLGEDGVAMAGDDGGVAEAITRLLQLQRRLSDRESAHAEEKQRLADRIRALERDAASAGPQQDQAPPAAASRPTAAASGRDGQSGKKAGGSVPKSLSNASSVLKGGFKSIREAAGV